MFFLNHDIFSGFFNDKKKFNRTAFKIEIRALTVTWKKKKYYWPQTFD